MTDAELRALAEGMIPPGVAPGSATGAVFLMALPPSVVLSLLDRLAAEEWRPIETAPGQEEVLVCCAGMLGWWAVAWRLLTEWRTVGAYGGDPLPISPTHWRPLPAPPKETQA